MPTEQWFESSGADDVAQRRSTLEELRRLRLALDTSGDMVYLVDRETMRFVDVNGSACRCLGVSRDEHLRLRPDEVTTIDRAELERTFDRAIAAGDKGVTIEVGIVCADGTLIDAELRCRALRSDGRTMVVATARDVTRHRRVEAASERLRMMFATLSATNEAILRSKTRDDLYQRLCHAAVDDGGFLSAAIAVLYPGTQGIKIVAAAGDGARTTAVPSDDGRMDSEGLMGTAYRTRLACVSNDFLNDARTYAWHEAARELGVGSAAAVPLVRTSDASGVIVFCARDRGAFDEEIVALLERMAENIVFALDNLERESEGKEAADNAQYLATHDVLTGLPNRMMFSELLSHALETARRYGRQFAVLFLDLDRFKLVNDSLGHDAGDALLTEITTRLLFNLRNSDVVARLGGDEFVILVQEVRERSQVAAVAQKILSATIKPVEIMGHECRVTASIGIAMFPAHAHDEQTLMKHADMAMYVAKEGGKNQFQFYSKDLRSQSLERLAIENHLRYALERKELSLNYQARVELKTGKIDGMEALIRWNNPELGQVSPMQFLPVAEDGGLILAIGRWVLRTACAQSVAWHQQGLPPLFMAVNLSERQFYDPHLLSDLSEVLAATGMSSHLLELEVTESTVMRNPPVALAQLRAIKNLGMRIAIDDFGTGYTALGQLKEYPIDTLKVDRSFMRVTPSDEEGRSVTEAILAMGKTLSLTVVAEGVETEEQVDFLRRRGCDQMQGYYFSKPLAADHCAELVLRHQPPETTLQDE